MSKDKDGIIYVKITSCLPDYSFTTNTRWSKYASTQIPRKSLLRLATTEIVELVSQILEKNRKLKSFFLYKKDMYFKDTEDKKIELTKLKFGEGILYSEVPRYEIFKPLVDFLLIDAPCEIVEHELHIEAEDINTYKNG